MKRLVLVEIDVDESQFCFCWKETLLGDPGIRCLQCLDAETAAHKLLKAAEAAKGE